MRHERRTGEITEAIRGLLVLGWVEPGCNDGIV